MPRQFSQNGRALACGLVAASLCEARGGFVMLGRATPPTGRRLQLAATGFHFTGIVFANMFPLPLFDL
jgi:hypothetical protein